LLIEKSSYGLSVAGALFADFERADFAGLGVEAGAFGARPVRTGFASGTSSVS
jgi:hypothetical protein